MLEEEAPAPISKSATGGILAESLPSSAQHAESEVVDAPEVEVPDPEVMARADSGHKAKTTMPRIAAGGRCRPKWP